MPLGAAVAAGPTELEVVAAGGVTGESARRLLEATGVPAIHGSCSHSVTVEAGGEGRALSLGKAGAGPEDRRLTLEHGSAGQFIVAARGAPS